MSTITHRLASCLLLLWIATTCSARAADVFYTFDHDEPQGPYADAFGADGAQDAAWWWEGTPGIDRDHPIFGRQSLVTTGPAPSNWAW